MSADIRLLFVGGPEDGLYHVIPDDVEMWRAQERKELNLLIDDQGANACNETFKVFVYVRRGNAMHLI